MGWFPRHGAGEECARRSGSTALVILCPEERPAPGMQSGCALEGSSLLGGDAGKDSDRCVWRLL